VRFLGLDDVYKNANHPLRSAIDKMKMDKYKNELNNLTEEERFDLLSAYIDEEVTTKERELVQYWLDSDREFQKLYLQLNQLSDGIQNLPIPVSEISTQELSEQVFDRLDRRSRFKQLSILAGGAIAAMFVGAGLSFLPNFNSPRLQMVTNNSIKESEPLMIAINEPIVEIPQTVEASEK